MIHVPTILMCEVSAVSKDIGSERYRRILDLVAFLKRSGGKATRRAIEQNVGGYAKDGGGTYRQNRMLQNDLTFMRNFMGAEIDYDHRSGLYVLKHEGSLLVNIEATPAEIEALSAGLKMASHFLPHLKKDALKLWAKIANYIPADLAGQGEALAEATLAAIPVEPVNPELFKALTDARNAGQAVQIRYTSPGKDARKWVISPYDFYFRGSAWYMISFNHKHGALSTHRISRITRVYPSGERYIPPTEGGFSAEYTASAWYVSPGTERHRIRLRLKGGLAGSALLVKWHPSQKTEEQEDGSVILTAEVPHLDDVARWVLAGAPNAKVIEPPALKCIVRNMAMKIIDEV